MKIYELFCIFVPNNLVSTNNKQQLNDDNEN